jgi:hypothetical protein
LYVGRTAVAPPDGSNVGDLFRAYRTTHSLTQGDLAMLLGFDQLYVSMMHPGFPRGLDARNDLLVEGIQRVDVCTT